MTTELETIRDEVISKLCRRPFKPFAVELGDGSRHFITRVAQMAVGLTTGIIANASGDDSRHIKISEIAAIQDL
jgi:hypothetical protein